MKAAGEFRRCGGRGFPGIQSARAVQGMGKTVATDTPDQPDDSSGRQPIAPQMRRMLQQMFEHGSRSSAQGQFDYATEMFTKCVLADPGNLVYVQSFLGNLQKKYSNNKTGVKLAGIRGAGSKGSIKKAGLKKEWNDVLKSGVELLKLNPWDAATLGDMAYACEQLQYDEAQLVWLKGALDADIRDPDVNRLAARAHARQGQFDEAIVCWKRVLQAKPTDEEANRGVANLTVERTIERGGYESAESSTDVMADKQARAERQGTGGQRASPEQQLEKLIAKEPQELSRYLELSELHLKQEKFEEAEKVLARAVDVSGGSIDMKERLEDVQLKRARAQVIIAKKQAENQKTPEANSLYQQMTAELNNKELEVYRNRCDRYPANLGFRYEMGVRLMRARNFGEAIKTFQEARGDLKRKGQVAFSLGVCFESIKQYKLAMNNYIAAIAELAERDMDQRKLALYRAATLAMDRLLDLEAAEKYLTELAELDFGYRDVSERLDKLAKLRDHGSPPGDQTPPDA